MRRHSTVNFMAKTLFACSARDGRLTTLQDVIHLVNCRLLGLSVCAFAMSSCLATSWDYPAVNIGEATELRNAAPLKCTIDPDAVIPNLFGTGTALKAIMKDATPGEGPTSGSTASRCEAWLYQAGGYPSDSNHTAYDLLSAMTLLALPAFVTEEYGVVYTVFSEDRSPKKYEYRIKNAGIMWLGFIPVGLVQRWVDPRPAKAVEATHHQFLIDANRDGLLK
ncbi:MAG: hypothetical protein JW395_1011 [Nitrospira sp.]|jgi:hypothetical protein|nr:hypothetical protein [Nitrospira sp.]